MSKLIFAVAVIAAVASAADDEACAWPGQQKFPSGFDRTRYCRDKAHTYKNPTCCNYQQDKSIRENIGQFLLPECLADDQFKDISAYLKEIYCVPCKAAAIDDIKYLNVIDRTGGANADIDVKYTH